MVSVRSTSQSGTSDSFGSSCTVPVPSGAASGDIVVLLLEQWESGNPTVTWPSGFQASQLFEIVSGSQKFKGNWKRLTAGDTGNYVMSWTGSQWNMGHAVCIQDALASGDPIDDIDTNTTASGTNEATITNTLSTVALQIHSIAKENSSLQSTTPTGFTEQRDGDYITTNTRVAPGTGSQSASGGVLAASTLQLGVLIGIKPAAGGSTIDLVVQDATIGISSDNIALTQVSDLVVQDAALTTTSDNLTLTQVIDLAIQKAFLATRATTPNLTQIHNIVVHKAFLQTAADLVNLAGGLGGPVTITDIQKEKLATLTGLSVGSINDLFHAYYGGLSGLSPVARFSVTDHQRTYWEAQTGLSGRSMADLEKAFYDSQLVPSGSLADREYVYWDGL